MTDLGRIVSRLQLSRLPYETYLQGQKLVATYLAQMNRSASRLASTIWFVFAFAATFYITSTVPGEYAVILLFVMIASFAILLFSWRYQRARLYKNVYNSISNVSCDIYIGENGLLIEAADFSEYFGWSNLALCLKNKHGLFLIMKNIQVVSISEVDLQRSPERDALLEFIEGKIYSDVAI